MACERYLGEDNKMHGRSRYLHVELMNPEHDKNIYVDHRNHDTLNNLESNLRCTLNNQNLKHRSGKNINNSSGYRNVCWDNRKEKWIVQLQIDGKNRVLGEFTYEALDKAGELAERMREKYYGEFKGES